MNGCVGLLLFMVIQPNFVLINILAITLPNSRSFDCRCYTAPNEVEN